jgi:hypothetical protein
LEAIVHDATVAALPHRGDNRAAAQEDAREVGFHDASPLVEGQLLHQHFGADEARSVDEDVRPPEALERQRQRQQATDASCVTSTASDIWSLSSNVESADRSHAATRAPPRRREAAMARPIPPRPPW